MNRGSTRSSWQPPSHRSGATSLMNGTSNGSRPCGRRRTRTSRPRTVTATRRPVQAGSDRVLAANPKDPVVAFKRGVYVTPFWEENFQEVVDIMGADRCVFGSDWPHPEGLSDPITFVDDLKVDSLSLVEYTMELEDSLGVELPEDEAIGFSCGWWPSFSSTR